MIDTALIKENYARMTNEELIHLAKSEGEELTPEALTILHDEFLQRNMDSSVFGNIDDKKTTQQKENIQKAQSSASDAFANSIWDYVFNEKEAGASDEEIHDGIIERGLNEESALMIIKSIESKAKEIISVYESHMLRGGIICLIGVAITYWTYSYAANGGSYVVAWGAIIFGAVRFFRALAAKSKYDKILKNIAEESEPENATE